MALKLIVGPAGAGKRSLLQDAYVAAVSERGDATLVVTTRAAIRSTRGALLVRDRGTLLGGDVTTFDGVFRAVADRARRDPPRTLSRDRRLHLLRRLIEELRRTDALGRHAAAAGSTSFPVWLDQAFGRFGSALVRPEDVARAAAEEDSGLAAVYERWWRRQDELGAWDQGRLRIEAVAELDPKTASSAEALLAAWPSERPLFVHGFAELTRSQARLVELVASRASVTLTLPFVDGREAMQAHSRTFADLYAAVPSELVVLERRPDASRPRSFDRLERELFSHDAGRAARESGEPVAASEVALVDCASIAAERRAIVGRVVETLRAGVAPASIAVVIPRTLDRTALVAALEAASVPLAPERPLPLRRSAFGHALRALLRAAWSAEAERRDLFTYLRSPGSGFDRQWVDGRERWLRSQGLHELAGSLAALGSGAREDRTLDRLSELISDLRVGRPLAASFAATSAMARAWAAAEPNTRELSQAALALSVLEELGAAGPGDGEPTRREIISALDVAQADEPPTGEGIAVLGLDDADLLDADVVIACGLELGGLDDVASPEIGLSSETRARLDGALEPPDPALAMRLRLYTVLTAARHRLVLIRRVADETGLALASSSLHDHLTAIIGVDPTETAERVGRGPAPPLDQAVTEHEQLLALAVLSRSDRSAATRLAARLGLGQRLDSARRRSQPRSPALRNPAALAELAAMSSFGVTGLELFLECSSRWFAERGLGVRTLDRGWDRMAIGTTAHLVLERFFRAVPAWFPIDERVTLENLPEARARLAEVIGQVFGESKLPTTTPEAVAARREVERGAGSILLQEARARQALTRRLFELNFGRRNARRGYPVDGGAEIAGKIDRVDLELAFSTGAVLHDYKLTTGYTAKEIASQRRLQPLVYSSVVERDENVRALAFVYRALRPGNPSRGVGRGEEARPFLASATDRVDDERWDELRALADSAAAEAVRRIRTGDVRRDPSPALRTNFCRDVCSSRSVCRIGQAREEER